MKINGSAVIRGNLSNGALWDENITTKELASNQSVSAGDGETQITGFLGVDFPTTPNGSRRYRVTFQSSYQKTSNAGAVTFRIRQGNNGLSSTLIWDADGSHASIAGRNGSVQAFGLVIQPAAGDKLHFSVETSTNSVSVSAPGTKATITELPKATGEL